MTNRHQIVPAALAGKTLVASGMSTKVGAPNTHGWLPSRLSAVLCERRRHITQVIYSYRTPIAWLDDGTWVVPDVRYSVMTSTQHQSQLWMLPHPVRVVADTVLQEYLRVLRGQMVYAGDRTVPGPQYVLD